VVVLYLLGKRGVGKTTSAKSLVGEVVRETTFWQASAKTARYFRKSMDVEAVLLDWEKEVEPAKLVTIFKSRYMRTKRTLAFFSKRGVKVLAVELNASPETLASRRAGRGDALLGDLPSGPSAKSNLPARCFLRLIPSGLKTRIQTDDLGPNEVAKKIGDFVEANRWNGRFQSI